MMTRRTIYLDHNATTPLRPEARAAMVQALSVAGNPSSVHGFGRAARKVVEDAREEVAALAGASPAAVVFTGGGTEANALALNGCGRRRALVSSVEHASVLQARADVELVPVDGDGIVDLCALDEMLAAGAEGGDRVALDVVAGIIRVPVHVVEVETAKLFSTIAQAATLQLLPALHAIKRTTQERLAPSAALCARVASEVLLMPICPTLAAEVADMYYHPSRGAITGPVSYGQAPQEAGRIA